MRSLQEWADFFVEKQDAALNIVNDPDAEYTKKYLALGDIKACNILITHLDLILDTAKEDEYIDRVERLIERFQGNADINIRHAVSEFKRYGRPVYDVDTYEVIFDLGVVKLLKEILDDLGFRKLFSEIIDK
ncbi:hypothetical protein D307_gp033 [Bacillus phage Bastille]|uniref:Uncharacterized protein n=1 Tax=Bacillus phage Bastille TaxID=57477 RepID=J9PMF8_9CAUD|nr:hypothetical protein D307_gp033 [Bacillus phage Bastille]AEQ34431.1 hypothetical protein [Bacillus phage Bastille]AZF89130.1 hypothetical protein Goe5_c00220 [Bacillus phage vB_BthM-Goe5]